MGKNGKHDEGNDETGKVMEQKVTREILFKLSLEEQKKMADTAATLSQERNTFKQELDLYGRTKRKEIKDLQKEIDRLLACHKNGNERREATVTERLDWENKRVSIYHKDEMIEEREMHEAELQMKLNTTNETARVAPKKGKQTRAQKDPDKHLTPEEQRSAEIASVHKLETKKGTKKSAVDKSH